MAAVNFAEIDNHLFKGWVGGGRDLNGSERQRSQMLSAHFTFFGGVNVIINIGPVDMRAR
jgi:hypothetical protein